MKGFTNIKLYDTHGNMIKDQDDNNMITNLLGDYIKEFGSIISKTQSTVSGEIEMIMSSNEFSALSLIGGILLFKDNITEKAENTIANQFSIASAGGKNDYTHPLKGSLNTNESGAVNEDGKKGYKWVWDFGTSNANCTFNSVCLTTKDAGDRNTYINEDSYIGNKDVSTDFFNDGKQKTICFNDSYMDYKIIDDEIFIRKEKKSLSFNDKIEFFNYEKINIGSMYSQLSSTILEDKGNIYFIALNNNSNEKDLVRIDNNGTLTATELTTLNSVYSDRIEYFGLAADNLVFNIHKVSGDKYLHFRSFDLNSKTCTTIKTDFETSYTPKENNIYNRAIILRGENDKFVTTLSIATSSNTYFTINIVDNNIYHISEGGTGQIQCISTPTNNVGVIGKGYDTSRKKLKEAILFPVWKEPLFTINNLESTITKTEANTMKISYTILY